MAYHEVDMWEILQVLGQLHRREPKSAIARTTGHSRSTIRRYERLALELGWTPGGDAPEEALAAQISQRVQPAAERSAGDREGQLLPVVEQIRAWLTPGPRASRLSRTARRG